MAHHIIYLKVILSIVTLINPYGLNRNNSNIEYKGLYGYSLEEFNNRIKSELSKYHIKFNDIYNSFTSNSNKLSKKYRDYMEQATIDFYSLANDVPVHEEKQFSTSLNKIPASLFYVSTVLDLDNILTMQMRNTYELMQNLLNGYINKWKVVIIILGEDAKKCSEKIIFPLIILIMTVFF